MTTLWAIEVTPLDGRGKPWINHLTVSCLRKDAWEKFIYKDAPPDWLRIIDFRRRKGLLRAVKVTLQLVKDQS